MFNTCRGAGVGAAQVVPVVLLKRESVVTDALRYCDDVGAGLLAMGSQALASPGTMTGSVALSMTREATRPLLIVKVGPWGPVGQGTVPYLVRSCG